MKKTALYARDHTVHESLAQVKALNAAILFSEDLAEAMRAVMVKRKSEFRD